MMSARFIVLASALSVALGCSIKIGSSTATKQPAATGDEAEQKPAEPKPEEPAKPKPKNKPQAEKPAPKPEKPKPEKPKPIEKAVEKAVEKPVEKPAEKPAEQAPPPQPDRSKIVLPVKIAFDVIKKELEALIPRTDSKDWAQVTKGNDSPKAELKYELWRDPIELELEGHTFHVTVPVRYAATIRAQVKNPLRSKDWIWIAKSETWGTKQEPQRITAHFEASVRVEDDWRIKSDIKLVKLEHGEPPSGKICENVGIEVCVPKSSVASEVREGIDKRLEPKLRKALEKLDGKIEGAFDLHKRATAVWRAVQVPAALPGTKDGAWLVVRPSAFGVGWPVLDGSDVRVDLAVEGQLSVESGAKPKVTPTPLPQITKVSGAPGFHVVAKLRVPADALSAALQRELKGLDFKAKNKDQITITRAQVIARADEKHPRRVVVQVAFGADRKVELELRGDLVYDAASQRLAVEELDFSSSSQSVLAEQLAGFDHDALRKKLAAKARWDLGAEAGPTRAAIAAALEATLRGHASLRGDLKQLDVRKLEMKADALEVEVIVGGVLEVAVDR